MNQQDDLLLKMNNILNDSKGSCFDHIADMTFLSKKMLFSELDKEAVYRIRNGDNPLLTTSTSSSNLPHGEQIAFNILGAIGSGKSTITRLLYSKGFFAEDLEFICEDLIKSTYFNDILPLKYAYSLAKQYLSYKIVRLLQNRHSFVYEFVPSNKDKLKTLLQIKNHGYRLISIYLCTDNEQVNVERVKSRIFLGADFVSPQKIASRYYLTKKYLDDIVSVSDLVYLINSSEREFKLIGYSTNKQIIMLNS